MVDRPREQRRDALVLDLRGAGGHVAVIGSPRSGKSTLARSMVAALALVGTPHETRFYVLDFGGGTFAPFSTHPHVAAVATRSSPDLVHRVLTEVEDLVARREAYFAEHGIDTIETYRARRARGQADDGWGEVVLVVDGWSALRSEVEDAEPRLQALAARALAYGVHLVITAHRWADLRLALRDAFGTRLELRLGSPIDSEIDRTLAATVPAGRPGRGLTPTREHFLAALPRLDGSPDLRSLADAVDDLVARTRSAWTGPPGPKLRVLPGRVERAELAGQGPGDGLVLGVAERDHRIVTLDPGRDPHLLVIGDHGSGKTTLLRGIAHELVRTRTPREAQLVLVDYRRSLLGEVPDDHLLHDLTSADAAEPALRDLATYLRTRLSGPQLRPEELRDRSWWTGAEVFVLVDDHDLVSTSRGSPLAPLLPLLPQARDVGLHLVLARRSGGAGRALFEPTIQTLRELGQPGLLLAGSPEEGPLLGGLRAAPAPPGRARLITRERSPEVLQLAWSAPSDCPITPATAAEIGT